tara:strand:- start:7 stop:630 length:624 start_codon:yes stop_codon:yes gene_type:complete
MAIPGLGAAATSDKGKRFLSGFTDFLTGGMTDLDQRGDSRLQEFQKNQSRRNIEAIKGFGDQLTGGLTDFDKKGDSGLQQFGKKATGAFGQAMLGGKGSLARNAMDLVGINGTQRMDTGETSQGAQELAQKVQQNEMSGLQQRTASFLQNMNPYNSLYPGSPENPMDPMGVPLVPGPDGQLINENLMKLTGGDPDELERRRQILGGM